MKNKTTIVATLALLFLLVFTSTVSAQYAGKSWVTVYQIANMGTAPADITVSYYNAAGTENVAARKTFLDVAIGGSVNVNQFVDDPNLTTGQYSAVVSADQPVAAVVNMQLVATGSLSYSPEPPFASYSGASTGSYQVTLPTVMYNFYGYYTEFFVMNVGSAAASNVDISYYPNKDGANFQGAQGVVDNDNAIPQFASLTKSQQSTTALGCVTSCGGYTGKFLGSATITSDQPIIAVVNQHTPSAYKLMTYNGFGSSSKTFYAPSHMRGFYGYYATLIVSNPTANPVDVDLIYSPDTTQSVGSPNAQVIAHYTIPAHLSISRYDGPGSTGAATDLAQFTRFFGSVKVNVTTADPAAQVVVQSNIEAVNPGPSQAGSYTGIPESQATQNVVVPVVLSNFYGYYTTVVIQNTTNTAGTCNFSYTSGPGSTSPGLSKSYNGVALPANGVISIWEGPSAGAHSGQINTDAFWGASPRRFIGSATVACTVNVVSIVNEELDYANKDSMYTFNAFNK